MAIDFELALANLKKLSEEFSGFPREQNLNEATTRLRFVNRLLFDCLGWDHEDCVAEERFEGTYTDYSLGLPSRRLVVEAKREGEYFTLPVGSDGTAYRIATLIEGNKAFESAVRQAIGYCQERGIPLGAVCNGHQIACFLGSRQDGVPPMTGTCLVFASFKEMIGNFRVLWDNLSKPAAMTLSLFRTLSGQSVASPPEKLLARIVNYPGVRQRNRLQAELQILGDLFIEDVVRAPEIEKEFLERCYCESGALSQHALVSKEILRTRYSLLLQRETTLSNLQAASKKKGAISKEFSADILTAALSGRPIILLGDVGVGKTIFLRHFIKIDATVELEKAIVLYVDFGREPALVEDLKSFVVDSIIRQLREADLDVFEDGFIKKVYRRDIERFGHGVYSGLRSLDQKMFEMKLIEYLDSLLSNRPRHLESSLRFVARDLRRNLVLFLDNVDQRPHNFQDEVFLIAQSLAETWPMTVFLCLRPETFHRSKTKGSLSGYQPRVFAVAPPRVDNVISKRIGFALDQLKSTGRLNLFPKGLTLKSDSLTLYLQAILNSLERGRDLIEFIDN